jgi:small-conductance mechanosensitive channel
MPRIGLLARSWYGPSVTQWLIAAATLGGAYLVLAVGRRVLVKRLGALAARTTTDWDDAAVIVLERTRSYFLFVVALYAATRTLELPGTIERVLRAIYVVVTLVQAAVWGSALVSFAADHYTRQRAADDIGTRTTITAVAYAGRFVLWALLLVTGLQNFGINVTALVTGLGIGGIAIALALQNILGDLFAALAIVLDKPFVVGDSIQVDAIAGTVEHVGLKTTRLRSVNGEQVIFGNNDLLKSRIRNFKRMHERRVVFALDLSYDTAPDQLARIPEIVRVAIAAQPLTRFDRCHLLTFGESALRFETVYSMLDADYAKYAATQHAINLELLRRFAGDKIRFAFPTRTVYLQPTGT